jgi:hypothetical protein
MKDQQTIDQVVSLLQDVDGETMQYILEKVGMEDQMLRQLMLSAPINQVRDLWTEALDWDNEYN